MMGGHRRLGICAAPATPRVTALAPFLAESDMEPETSFGTWISRRRQSLGLTRERLAARAGCSVSALRKIEGDERRPSLQLAELLADCLQIAPTARPLFVKVARGHTSAEHLAEPDASSVGPPPPPRLPQPAAPLVGREAEVAAISRLLEDPDCRLLTVIGPGGIGKTRLALAAAAQRTPAFPDGCCFVSLAALTSARLIAPAIADALGFRFAGSLDPQDQLVGHLRDRAMLLVLDNMEHLLEGAELVRHLLAQAPHLKLLITSRERINMRGEWLFDLHGLPVPPEGARSPEQYSAVALFVQCARRVRPDLSLSDEELATVARVCRLVEGTPLALELAAGWLRTLGCAEIAAEIERGLDFLSGSLRDLPKRQRSLRATFEHSWSLLTDDERWLLCRLAVFGGGFERDAAEHVAGATLPSLSALVDKSLVRRSAAGRYDLHEVVRQYARAHLEETEAHSVAVHERHAAFYLAMLARYEPCLRSADQQSALQVLNAEIDNLRDAWAWSSRNRRLELIRIGLRGFGWLFELRGGLREGAEQLDVAVQAARACPPDAVRQEVLGVALAQQGLLLFRIGTFDHAQVLLEESRAILRPLGSPELLAPPLIYSGIVMHLCGQLEPARALLEEGLACAQAAREAWFVAYATFSLGHLASLAGHDDQGCRRMRDGLACWRALGDPRSITIGLNFLSQAMLRLGRIEEARVLLEESVALCARTGDRWGAGTAYRLLGLAALRSGDAPAAQALLRTSLQHFGDIVGGWDISCSLVYLGEATAAGGDLSAARQILCDALTHAWAAHATALVLDALVALAELDHRAGATAASHDLALLVARHPQTNAEARERAARILLAETHDA